MLLLQEDKLKVMEDREEKWTGSWVDNNREGNRQDGRRWKRKALKGHGEACLLQRQMGTNRLQRKRPDTKIAQNISSVLSKLGFLSGVECVISFLSKKTNEHVVYLLSSPLYLSALHFS